LLITTCRKNELPLDNEDRHYIFPGLAFRAPPQLMSLYLFIFPGMLNPLSCLVEDIVSHASTCFGGKTTYMRIGHKHS